jgi:hypothetical protein
VPTRNTVNSIVRPEPTVPRARIDPKTILLAVIAQAFYSPPQPRQAHRGARAPAGAWFRARLLQRYLRALRRTTGEGEIQGALGDETVDFLLWAEQYVAQLDPLSATPANPDQQRDRPSVVDITFLCHLVSVVAVTEDFGHP